MDNIKLAEIRTSLRLYRDEVKKLEQTNFKYLDTALKYLNTEIDKLTKMIESNTSKKLKNLPTTKRAMDNSGVVLSDSELGLRSLEGDLKTCIIKSRHGKIKLSTFVAYLENKYGDSTKLAESRKDLSTNMKKLTTLVGGNYNPLNNTYSLD